jgi:hypothetical protein
MKALIYIAVFLLCLTVVSCGGRTVPVTERTTTAVYVNAEMTGSDGSRQTYKYIASSTTTKQIGTHEEDDD